MSTERPYKDCTLLEWIDKGFAKKIAPACQRHDEDYHFYRGWLSSDWRFIKAMWAVSKWRAVLYGTLLPIGSWFLYYDIDKKLGRWFAQ